MRIRLQLLANQNWRSNGCYQSLACAPGSGYENGIHRDYKRIEWASRDKSRDKLNKSNGGSGIYVPGIIPSSVHLCVYRCIAALCIELGSQAIEREC